MSITSLLGDKQRFDVKPDDTTMKAVVTMANGGYEQLNYTDVPMPKPLAGEVLVQVLAAGVNNTEINTRLGWYSSKVTQGTDALDENDEEKSSAAEELDGGWNEQTPFPFIQGTDCCGRIVAVGEGVDPTRIGERILIRSCIRKDSWDSLENIWMASDFDGAFAQYVKITASEAFAVECDWSDAELGTIPCAYGTAENMVHRAGVSKREHVLVTGASGGVGSAVVQLAKRRGAQVTAVVGKNKMDVLMEIGADRVIERNSDLVEVLGEKSVDVVIDNVAGEGFTQMSVVMKRGGRYASSGAIAGPIVTLDMRNFYLKDLTFIGCTAWDEPVFPNLVSYIERGEIKPMLARTYPLEDIVTAQKDFSEKKHVGKIVLLPPEQTPPQQDFIDSLKQ
ncbi:alcohol dehydrogenase zinc-binding domain-containing protein [Alteromonas mediterranea MED64]|uniref:alcohol dehydrogenase family protein n=1 Tax=Alteromonas mediterranea TaxID=314275 RepID=UPI0003556F4D|nr:alcohol dehydrogenase family protein [Alteromonas mediterranea]AGP82362.1 alcohol dehydrogenase zinc-binding domain-containing protein [Alteromonas mediterranea MED64]|tara:strand:- start:1320 stop:2498 length:1179 start_codon:yes stop_codon:yes gene_type:complete